MNEGRKREQVIGSLTELWMRKDPVKTSEWLTSLPADAKPRHSGVARFAQNLAPDDPERAAQWTASIPDSYWQKEGVIKTVLAAVGTAALLRRGLGWLSLRTASAGCFGDSGAGCPTLRSRRLNAD